MKSFDIVQWVKGLSKSEAEALEDAVITNSANTCGNVYYFVKPYLKFIPIFNKLEVYKL